MTRLIIFAIFLLPLLLWGQVADSAKSNQKQSYRNEVGVKILSLMYLNHIAYGLPRPIQVFNGLCYKYNFRNKFVSRNTLEWQFYKNEKFDIEGFLNSDIQRDITFKSGMEWRFCGREIILFLAADISYEYIDRKGISHYNGDFWNEATVGFGKRRSHLLGVEASIGIVCYPARRISLSIETSLIKNFYWYKLQSYVVYLSVTDPAPVSTLKLEHGWDNTRYNHLRLLTLSYNF